LEAAKKLKGGRSTALRRPADPPEVRVCRIRREMEVMS
jgi:hypothetical protein